MALWFAIKIINIDDADFQEHVLDKDNTINAFQKEVAILQQLKDNNAKNINLIHDAFDMHNQLWIISDYCTGGSLADIDASEPPKRLRRALHHSRGARACRRSQERARHWRHPSRHQVRQRVCQRRRRHPAWRLWHRRRRGRWDLEAQDDRWHAALSAAGDAYVKRSHQTDEAYGTEVDIWSFGITVYEMATGLPPYTNVHPSELAEATVNAPRLEGGEYSDGLRDFVAFCLNGNAKERPSAADVLQHPYIAGTEQKYPTRGLIKLIERYAVWEYGGGQRQSLFFAGGAAAPVVPD